MRYTAEGSGAVLDTQTGLREWFNSFKEAIEVANKKNDADYSNHVEAYWNEMYARADAKYFAQLMS